MQNNVEIQSDATAFSAPPQSNNLISGLIESCDVTVTMDTLHVSISPYVSCSNGTDSEKVDFRFSFTLYSLHIFRDYSGLFFFFLKVRFEKKSSIIVIAEALVRRK